jgi:hypothetical protein
MQLMSESAKKPDGATTTKHKTLVKGESQFSQLGNSTSEGRRFDDSTGNRKVNHRKTIKLLKTEVHKVPFKSTPLFNNRGGKGVFRIPKE